MGQSTCITIFNFKYTPNMPFTSEHYRIHTFNSFSGLKDSRSIRRSASVKMLDRLTTMSNEGYFAPFVWRLVTTSAIVLQKIVTKLIIHIAYNMCQSF